MHVSTQIVRTLLDKGVRPDDQKESVRIFAVKASVVHIRLVYIAAPFALLSGTHPRPRPHAQIQPLSLSLSLSLTLVIIIEGGHRRSDVAAFTLGTCRSLESLWRYFLPEETVQKDRP